MLGVKGKVGAGVTGAPGFTDFWDSTGFAGRLSGGLQVDCDN